MIETKVACSNHSSLTELCAVTSPVPASSTQGKQDS